MFYVWSPTQTGTKSLEFVLTSLEADGVSNRAKPFAQKIAQALGLKKSKVTAASLTECRSNYFTDYPDEDWQSVWQPAWQWHVDFEASPGPLPSMKIAPWVACEDLYDANFKHNEHSWSTDFQREVHVLVVADFKAESKIQAAKNALLSASTISLAKKYQVAAPTIRLASTVGSWRQLQVNLGKFPGTFLEAPDYVDDVIGVLKKKGARTHHVHPY